MKKIIIFLLFMFLLIIPCSFAYSITSPSQINIEKVISGSYAEKQVEIKADNEIPLQIKLSSAGFVQNWISFEPASFYLTEFGDYNFKIIVNPPENITSGNYQGFIIIDSLPLSENQMTSTVSSSTNLKLNIEITDEIIVSAIVDYIDINDIIKGEPLEFNTTIENKGNTLIIPQIKAQILNKNKKPIIESPGSDNTEILPLSKKTIRNSIPNNLDVGDYFLHIIISLDNKWLLHEQTTGFKIYKDQIPVETNKEPESVELQPVALATSPIIIGAWMVILFIIAWKIYAIKKNKPEKPGKNS